MAQDASPGFVIYGGNDNSVASMPPVLYFTEDLIDNMQIRVSLRRQTTGKKNRRKPTTFKAWTLMRKTKEHLAASTGLRETRLDQVEEDEDGDGVVRGRRRVRLADDGDAGDDGDGDGDDDDGDGQNLQDQRDSEDVGLTRVLSWQEKVFSSREILHFAYHEDEAQKTTLGKQYAQHIRAVLKDFYPEQELRQSARSYCVDQCGEELASKTDEDAFIDQDEYDLKVTTSEASQLHKMAKLMVDAAGDTRGKTHHSRDRTFKSYYITATVDLPDNPNQIKHKSKASQTGYEKVLCHIRCYENGTFDMRPGFFDPSYVHRAGNQNDDDSLEDGWHYFTSPKGTLYAYRIENASNVSDQGFLAAREQEIRAELRARQVDLLRNRMSTDFDPPPPETHFKYNLFGEIVEAIGFEDSDVYVEYETSMPVGWIAFEGPESRQAVTQVSDVRLARRSTEFYDVETRLHNFSFPLGFELVGTTGKGRDKQDIDEVGMIRYPTMFFQVSSIDFWDRHRVLGYGYVVLPDQPGSHDVIVRTWRPEGSVRAQMQRFFIGGAPALQDKKLSGIPEDFHDRFFSRYGFRTEPSGSLRLRLHVVKSEHVPIQPDPLADVGGAGSTKRGDEWQNAVQGVLKRARQVRKPSIFSPSIGKKWGSTKKKLQEMMKLNQ